MVRFAEPHAVRVGHSRKCLQSRVLLAPLEFTERATTPTLRIASVGLVKAAIRAWLGVRGVGRESPQEHQDVSSAVTTADAP